MTAPKPGDRVRVVIEGTVRSAQTGTLRIDTGDPGLFAQLIDPRSSSVSVEVIEPRITYQPGDVARIGGNVALRVHNGWAFCDGSRLHDDQLAGRAPTPLVLGGRPVNAA